MLEGLEVSEILISKLENVFTIGAEYYSPFYLKSFQKLCNSSLKLNTLSDCCTLITDGDHGSADYVENGVAFVLSESVKNGWIDKSSCRQISAKHAATLERSKLRKHDVLITKTGIYFGRSAVVNDEFVGANTIAHVGLLRLKKQINPYYVSTFFNGIYGYSQLRRRGLKATRPEIKLIEFQDITLALPSKLFQDKIEQVVNLSYKVFNSANSAYTRAEILLLNTLGMSNFTPSQEPVNIKSYKESFGHSGRLDAEYYQPKYEQVLENIKKSPHQKLSYFIENYSTGYPYKSEDYIEDSGVPLIRINNIKKGYLDLSNTAYLPIVQTVLSEKDIANEGDILLSMSGTIGNTCVIPSGVTALINQRIMRFTPKNYDSLVLMLTLNSIIGESQLERIGTGGVQTNISNGDISEIIIPIIDIATQNQVAKLIQQSFALKAQSEYLLDVAKRAVEIAIEQDEAAAMAFITAQTTHENMPC